jgi:transposase
MIYDITAEEAARRIQVHGSTLRGAIQRGLCQGEEVDGHWYTSEAAASAWKASHYRKADAGLLLSPTAHTKWTEGDLERLRRLKTDGASNADIAKELGRSEASIKTKWSKMDKTGPAATRDDARQRVVREAKAVLSASKPAKDRYQERRQMEREGRVRLRMHPDAVAILGREARRRGVKLGRYLTLAYCAAMADPSLFALGRAEAEQQVIRTLESRADRLRIDLDPVTKTMIQSSAEALGVSLSRLMTEAGFAVLIRPDTINIRT